MQNFKDLRPIQVLQTQSPKTTVKGTTAVHLVKKAASDLLLGNSLKVT